MAAQLYWREHRTGQRLYLRQESGEEVEVGGVRRTPRGFDALAKTITYDPGRAKKDFATIHEAKLFVASFRPWEIFYSGDQGLKVEEKVRPLLEQTPTPKSSSPTEEMPPSTSGTPDIRSKANAEKTAPPLVASSPPITSTPTEAAATIQRSSRQWWQFWKGS